MACVAPIRLLQKQPAEALFIIKMIDCFPVDESVNGSAAVI